jgi:hypothetical protein
VVIVTVGLVRAGPFPEVADTVFFHRNKHPDDPLIGTL